MFYAVDAVRMLMHGIILAWEQVMMAVYLLPEWGYIAGVPCVSLTDSTTLWTGDSCPFRPVAGGTSRQVGRSLGQL